MNLAWMARHSCRLRDADAERIEVLDDLEDFFGVLEFHLGFAGHVLEVRVEVAVVRKIADDQLAQLLLVGRSSATIESCQVR